MTTPTSLYPCYCKTLNFSERIIASKTLKTVLVAAALWLNTFSASGKAIEQLSLCFEEWKPHAYTDMQSGEITGVLVENLRSIASASHIQLNFYELPINRCRREVKNGSIDFFMFTDPQGDLSFFPVAIANWQLAIISRPTRPVITQADFEQQKITNLMISKDYRYPLRVLKYLDKQNKQVFKRSYYMTSMQDIVTLFNLPTRGVVDTMLIDKQRAQVLKKDFALNFVISDWILHTEAQYLGYGAISQGKQQRMANLLDKMTQLLTYFQQPVSIAKSTIK